MVSMTRTQKIITATAGIVATLILGVGIAVVVALNAATAATQEQDYRACVTAAGLDSTTSAQDMVTIANRCTSSVYDQ